ncbi:MAG: DM13 domain-containing protein [Pseudomonadota bacterium]
MSALKSIFTALALSLSAAAFAPASFAETTVYAGSDWTNVKQKTQGDWSVVERDGAFFVELGESFKARKAPDLKIFLSKADADTRKNKNAIEDAVFVAKLTSHKGAQSYQLPADVNPADFKTLIIHCEQYTKLWAATPLA